MSGFKRAAATSVAAAFAAAFAAVVFAVGAFHIADRSVAAPIAACADSAVGIGSCTIELQKSTMIYNGKEKIDPVTVTFNDAELVQGTDYTLSYSNNVKIGTAKVKVTGIGNYSGSKTLTYKIVPKKLKSLTASAAQGSVTLKWEKVATCTGYKIYRYDPDAKKWRGVKNISSKNTLTWTNKNLQPDTEYKYRVKAYMNVGGTAFTGESTQVNVTTKGVNIAKLSGLKASATSNSVTLSWNKLSGVDGYKIYRYDSSTKKFKGVKSINSANTLSWTNKSLKANTTYKYRVKGYKKVSGTTYTGTSAEVSAKTPKATTPVAANGQLSVKGANIVNSSGEKFQIRGMSTHGIMWEDFSNILSKDSLKVFRDDWGVNTIRIAMYTEEWGGYTTGADFARQAKEKVNNGVANATDLGMYVIIDWHIMNQDGNPQKHQSEAIDFFTEMSKKYKDYNNVIYEICNEPNNSQGTVTWNANIKPYAEAVTKAIRKNDKDALIVVGTGTWSQDIDQAEKNRLSDKNTVYTLHFYANTHTDWLRNRFVDCYNKGLPILVTEFGTCDASGNGGYNADQTKKWFDVLDKYKVGYVNWSACGKSETASAFKSGTNLSKISSGTSQLTESGKLVREHFRKLAGKS